MRKLLKNFWNKDTIQLLQSFYSHNVLVFSELDKYIDIKFPWLAPMLLDGSAVTAKVIELYPWMEYEFRVYAINDLGEGECSVPSIKIKTWDASKFAYTDLCFLIKPD